MKRKLFCVFAVVSFAVVAGYNVYSAQSDAKLSDLAMSNVEALAGGEGSGGIGCGYAAYEWDNDWYEDTKHFIKCVSGCPEGSGTSPKYRNC